MPEDDGYGRNWDYRVFSQLYTCPDDWNVGHRYLSVHQVIYATHRCMMGTHSYPLPDDITAIEYTPASPHGVGMEELLQDAERIQQAFDKPVLIVAEFQAHFDWSQQLREQHKAYQDAAKETESNA